MASKRSSTYDEKLSEAYNPQTGQINREILNSTNKECPGVAYFTNFSNPY